ncbi:bifunctional ADP-dependent NAD(P)H-hydrate dehydratase/NAD(P)H-hydrate epimerase [Desulfohalobium retbaense]|uniref:Bifunctional NAD(P)H-hydrate repair enzyme n=1 Tax=Desulfohalobium retbaense (strain ATCC 49708 / DSM 5692 / JCM 16813 / HR100) TaxID=485915 RepID=C8X3I9_DESRD|nr:bifunctional ADP-dependent NAD(P)H-hydrate dehydratase/NAD(P)H-hydrate epimerase [Desulfohalobium retbaense]ACV68986.1 carbohydrate kinase, YjeF related protein [Desulfohalobium retbaense DSM 5692]
MYIPLPTPDEMALWDRTSIDTYGIDAKMLMENASREALHVLLEEFGSLQGKSAVVFAGSGNNAGDAFALARHMTDMGAKVMVLHKKAQQEYTRETAYHLQLALNTEVPLVRLPEYNLDFLTHPDIVVDGLLGTGFRGLLNKQYKDWINHINRMGKNSFVFALDIPSGINGWTGLPSPTAVKADATATFAFAKVGLFMAESRPYVGNLHVRSIGLPARVSEDAPPSHFGLDQHILSLYPAPQDDLHKGTAGHVLIVGGSEGLTGAPHLAALGALRGGAGLVTIAIPGALASEVKNGAADIMTLPLGEGGKWSGSLIEALSPHFERFDSVVIGPGLGRDTGSRNFLRAYLQSEHPPTVIDADALYWLAEDPQCVQHLDQECILTPHPGEMARLCRKSNNEVQQNRPAILRQAVQDFQCTMVFKGANTLITAPNRPMYVSPIACANLAIGGAGDILAGLIGSLRNSSLSPLQATCLGVYWHGFAGELLRERYPYRGNRATELADILPLVFKETHDAHSC